MNDFQDRMLQLWTQFKRDNRGVKATRFVLAEDDFLTLQQNADRDLPESELQLYELPVVRGQGTIKTHIE